MDAGKVIEVWIHEELRDSEFHTDHYAIGVNRYDNIVNALYVAPKRVPDIGSLVIFILHNAEIHLVFPEGHVREGFTSCKETKINLSDPGSLGQLKEILLKWKKEIMEFMVKQGRIPGYSPEKI